MVRRRALCYRFTVFIEGGSAVPLYEYRCQSCSNTFELLVRGSESPRCPSCQGDALDKLLSVFAVNAQGSQPAPKQAGGSCGSCGDPRGPGSCALN